jgi:hypothetical protein
MLFRFFPRNTRVRLNMCLPCWPWADIYLEDEPKKNKGNDILYMDPTSRTLVKLTNTTVSALMVPKLCFCLYSVFAFATSNTRDIHFQSRLPVFNLNCTILFAEQQPKPLTRSTHSITKLYIASHEENITRPNYGCRAKLSIPRWGHHQWPSPPHIHPTRRWLYFGRRCGLHPPSLRCCSRSDNPNQYCNRSSRHRPSRRGCPSTTTPSPTNCTAYCPIPPLSIFSLSCLLQLLYSRRPFGPTLISVFLPVFYVWSGNC